MKNSHAKGEEKNEFYELIRMWCDKYFIGVMRLLEEK